MIENCEFDIQSTVNIPSGVYFVGDVLCQMNETIRSKIFLSYNFVFDDTCQLTIHNNDYYIAITSLFADGIYQDEEGLTYPVDSGSLGIISADLLKELPFLMGQIVYINNPYIQKSDNVITIGNKQLYRV